MIELYKIITGKYDSNCSLQLYLRSELVHASVTRGNGTSSESNRQLLRKNHSL